MTVTRSHSTMSDVRSKKRRASELSDFEDNIVLAEKIRKLKCPGDLSKPSSSGVKVL